MALNEANVGYLPDVVLKEIKAGRKCEVTGGYCRAITSMDDYNVAVKVMKGKFGEVIQWKKDRTALIATRPMPEWAVEVFERHRFEAEITARWAV